MARVNQYRYLPMMKTKAGEITALQNLSAFSSSRILPIFHICKTVTPSFSKNLTAAWAGHMIGLDGSFNAAENGSPNAFVTLIHSLRVGGVHTMPSVSMTDPASYITAAFAAIDAAGLVAKTAIQNLSATITWITSGGLPSDLIDLVVDLRHLGDVDPLSYAGYITMVLNQNASALMQFRSVTLASSAAPKDHGSLARGPNTVTRRDWLLWQAVAPTVGRRLDYGDYLTGHPDLTEPPGAAMGNATVSARYTLDQHWLIIKGVSTGGAYGIDMRVQHQSHAAAIVGTSGFNGLANCWADIEIQHAVTNIANRSGRQRWAEYAANRHIGLVADRLP